MAFPSTRSASNGTQPTNSTGWTITLPATIEANDLILINVSSDGNLTNPTISGYTRLGIFAAAGNAATGVTFAKVAVGNEDGTTVTFDTAGVSEQGAWRAVAIQDWHGTISGGVEVGGSASGTATTPSTNMPNPGSFSPSWGAADTWWRALTATDDGRTGVTAYPTDFTINQNSDASGGAGGALLGGATRQVNAASQDPSTFTIDRSVAWAAWVVAVRPSSITTVSGSFTASAITKKTLSATAITDAVVQREQTAALTTDAVIKREQTVAATADAVVLREQTATLTTDAIIFRTISDTATLDAVIAAAGGGTITDSFAADALLGRVGPSFWISPQDGVPIDSTPVLEFRMADVAGPVTFFHLQLDRSIDFDSGSLRSYKTYEDNTGWEYWDGDSWELIPLTGVPASFSGNSARYTVQTPLSSGTWYRRIRGGTR